MSHSPRHYLRNSKQSLGLCIAASALAFFGCVARRSFTDPPQSRSSSIDKSQQQLLSVDSYAELFEESRRAKKAGKSSLDFSSRLYAPAAQSLLEAFASLDGLVKSTEASLDSDSQKKKFVAGWEEEPYTKYKRVVLDAQKQLPICRDSVELQKNAPNVKSVLECAIILSLAVSEYLRDTSYTTKMSSSIEGV